MPQKRPLEEAIRLDEGLKAESAAIELSKEVFDPILGHYNKQKFDAQNASVCALSTAIDYGLRESSYFAYPFAVQGGMSLALESAFTVGLGQNEANLPY